VVRPDEISETLPPEWNCLERYDPATTKLLHYTVVPTQPWKSDDNPLGHVWMAHYAEAVAAGAVPPEEVERGIAKGFLKPTLAACLSVAGATARSGGTADRLSSLELEARAARAEVMVAQARVAALKTEIGELELKIDQMRRSWTWMIGRAATNPIGVARWVLQRATRRHSDRAPSPAREVSPADLPALYREMHAKALFPGVTWRGLFESFAAAIPDLERRTILDFGCGPRGGLSERLPGQVIAYDPYVDAHSASPWERPFDVVFSSDVLEHLPQSEIENFASNVRRSRPEFVFLNISTRSAHKTFSNGVNVHLTVKPTRWWLDTLGAYWNDEYDCQVVRDQADECTLLFARRPGAGPAGEAAATR
jgi:hypothetical protein